LEGRLLKNNPQTMTTKIDNKGTDFEKFKKKTIDLFAERITDYVFLMIENDRELMKEYLDIIEQSRSLKIINSQIAQSVRSNFNLDLKNEKENSPCSKLIQGHDKFRVKRESN
jgi:hypothetical protein